MKNLIKIIMIFSFCVSSLLAEEFISVNQVGYLPGAEKYFISNFEADSFYVKKVSSEEIVFSGVLSLHSSSDKSTGMKTYKGDFSAFVTSGSYFIETSNGKKSFPFEISEDVFEDVYSKVMKSYYLQRCGMDLHSDYAGVFARPACHKLDAFYHPSTFMSGVKDTEGGWHDAGDYGKYTHNSAATLGIMLLSFELFPDKHLTDDLNIDESGNGIPDFLDECRYQLEWILKMQDETEGGVHYMVNTKNYTWSTPHNDSSTRYLYGLSSVSTGSFAAITAMASRIYSSYDPEFATQLLEASELAWSFLETYPVIVPTGGFVRPSDTHTGGYASYPDKNDLDERLWAAVELQITTGKDVYKNYTYSSLKNNTSFSEDYSWQSMYAYAKISYIFASQNLVDQTIQQKLKTSFINRCDYLNNATSNDGFHSSLSSGEYVWGSNGLLLGRGVYFILAEKLTGETKYYNAALKQINHILGVNGHNFSFVAKVGSNSVQNIHHASLETDGIHDIYPGLMAGGPNRYVSNDPVLQSHFSSNTPAALCYIDDAGSYASNENCIFYSAPLVFVSAYFTKDKKMTGISSLKVNNVQEMESKNYPNPFNNTTKIFFNLSFEDNIDFVIYDILGRKVFEKRLGEISSGIHEIFWNGKSHSGSELSSGLYIYKIAGKKNGIFSGKMVLLK